MAKNVLYTSSDMLYTVAGAGILTGIVYAVTLAIGF